MTEIRGFAKILFSKKSYQILDCRYESINIYILLITFFKSGIINFKDNYTIEENSVVYTSGSGGLFKTGIPIGKITYKSTKTFSIIIS